MPAGVTRGWAPAGADHSGQQKSQGFSAPAEGAAKAWAGQKGVVLLTWQCQKVLED